MIPTDGHYWDDLLFGLTAEELNQDLNAIS